jgi:hypothetical protein
MDDIRALIRGIIAEEVASLRAEFANSATVERVNVSTPAELTRFVLSVLGRAHEPGFAAALREGRLHFEPMQGAEKSDQHLYVAERPVVATQPVVTKQPEVLVTTVPAQIPELRKSLITERDLAAIGHGETRLRITKTARITPLANDEARRRGIRIERTIA